MVLYHESKNRVPSTKEWSYYIDSVQKGDGESTLAQIKTSIRIYRIQKFGLQLLFAAKGTCHTKVNKGTNNANLRHNNRKRS